MSLGLFRTHLLRLWSPEASEDQVSAGDVFGEMLVELLSDVDRVSSPTSEKLVIQAAARELRDLATWLGQELNVPENLDLGDWEWECGYYADYGIRLHRFLAAFAVRVEEGLSPTRETVFAWRATMPDACPEWNRCPLLLEFPSQIRSPTQSAEEYLGGEARAEVALISEFFSLAVERLQKIIEQLTPNRKLREMGELPELREQISLLADATQDLAMYAAEVSGEKEESTDGEAVEEEGDES